MIKPLLSVCIPNYNHSRYLPGAVEALLAQSVQPDEIIIVDDASTDDSVRIIEEMCRKSPKIKLLRNEVNQGCCYSVNRGLAEATGSLMFLHAADDLVLPGYFEKTISCLQQYPRAGVCVTRINYIDSEGYNIPYEKLLNYHSHEKHVKFRIPVFLSPADVLKRIKRQPWFICGGPSPLYRREVLLEAGGWHADLGPYTDWFGMHFTALKYGMVYVPEPLVAFRVVSGSFGEASSRNPLKAIQQLKRLLSLMQEDKFREVFPAAFIRQKGKDFTYGAFIGSLVSSRRDFNGVLDALIPATSFADRLLLRCFDMLLQVEKLTLKVYCRGKHDVIYTSGKELRQGSTDKGAGYH